MSPEIRARLRTIRAQQKAQRKLERDRKAAQAAVDAFNAANPVGTPVRYWTWTRESAGTLGATRSRAYVTAAGTPAVFVTGHNACIVLTHVQPVGAVP